MSDRKLHRRVRRERLRWHFADLLNRSRRTCWCDLVMWVMRDQRDRRDGEYTLRQAFGTDGCRSGDDFSRNGACYCGKFRTAAVDAQMCADGGPRGFISGGSVKGPA